MNYLKNIKLVNFRNHDDFELNLDNKITLIVGENGSGKTSVLEAVYICLNGKSFRAVDGEILKHGREFYRIELEYIDGRKEVIIFDGGRKNIDFQGEKSIRLKKKHKYPTILFLPEDLHLVEASPSSRRNYFDKFFSQINEKYYNSLLRYNRALKQRNEILKQTDVGSSSLFSWNIILAKYGAEISKIRRDLIEEINKSITDYYRKIADNKDEVIIKNTAAISESEYLNNLENNIQKDMILGYTSFGVHRDDFKFYFNNKMAAYSASRGELRSLILALKFIEADLVYEKLHKRAIVLLDDVFSELDQKRQKSLIKNFKNKQIILTSVDEIEM